MKKIQYRYKSNGKATKLEKLYTSYFFEEITHFDTFGKWYNYAISRNLLEKAFEIQKELVLCDSKIGDILNNTDSVQESVNKVARSVIKGNQVIHGLAKTFDNISLYIALSIIGTGVVFLFGVIIGIKLEPIYLFGIPICLFISDLLVRIFRQKSSEDEYLFVKMSALSKQGRWFFLVLTILQTAIAATIVFVISGVFSNDENRNFVFWILALLLGSLTIQIIRSIKSSKSEH